MQCPECGCEFEPKDSGDMEGMQDQMDPNEGAEMGSDTTTPFAASIEDGGAASGSPLAAQSDPREKQQKDRLLQALATVLSGGR